MASRPRLSDQHIIVILAKFLGWTQAHRRLEQRFPDAACRVRFGGRKVQLDRGLEVAESGRFLAEHLG